MGRASEQMIAMSEMYISNVPDKHICVKHIDDNSIKQFIRKNYSHGYCDYCKKDLKVVSLEDLLEFMMSGILNFYQDAANFMGYNSREGGYQGTIYSVDDLIQENIGLETEPFEVTEDIVKSIEEIAWANPNEYYDNESDELKYHWNYFKNIIKHKSRYLFQQNQYDNGHFTTNAFLILKEVGNITKSLNLIKKIDKGTYLFRCRQHNSSTTFKEIGKLVAPPEEFAIYPNRFSPSGISMLYSAFDTKTAVLETLSREHPSLNEITISKFKTKKDIYVVDFNKLPKIPSIFNSKKAESYHLIRFLYDLVRDFTKDISKDGKEHIEYVPTQVVTEYFRFPFNKNRTKKIEGIVYPSSKNKFQSSSVIFWNHKKCLENLELVTIEVNNIKKMNSF